MSMLIRRRDALMLLGAAATSLPPVARAQQPALPVIGFLHSTSANTSGDGLRSFRQGLSEAGFVEGRNVIVEYRWAEGRIDLLPTLAADLADRQVRVIVAIALQATRAAKAKTSTIPIVFLAGVDPVAAGLVSSLSRPGGNLTGVSNLAAELGPKRLELLHEAVPSARTVALLVNPSNAGLAETLSREVRAAAGTLGLQLHVLNASTEHDLDAVFAALAQLGAGALMIANDPFLISRSDQLAALATLHRVPAIHSNRGFPAAGGLMSYDGNSIDLYRVIGNYTGRILKGEKPADLPVQQATRVELIINTKTAKALGLTFPITLLGRADEVIE